MRKFILGAVIVGALFAVSMLVTGRVVDKGASGVAGNKSFSILVDYRQIGLGGVWLPVPERVWDHCAVGGRFPQCGG